MKNLAALAALSLLTTDPSYHPVGRSISEEAKQPLEVRKGYQHQPKPLSKKQKAKRRK